MSRGLGFESFLCLFKCVLFYKYIVNAEVYDITWYICVNLT